MCVRVRWAHQEKLHDALTCFLDERSVRLDLHAGGRGHGAGGDGLRRLLHLHQAHAAVAGDGEPVMVAEARDLRKRGAI